LWNSYCLVKFLACGLQACQCGAAMIGPRSRLDKTRPGWQFRAADEACAREATVTDERIVKLEMLAAEQERVVEDLSAAIAGWWREIDRLRKALEARTGELRALEARAAGDTPVTRPPHW